jgi:fatty acid desaturase
MEPDSPSAPRRTLTELLFVLFLRMIAITCFWFGLQYWAMLVGYSLDGRARFDLLNLPWRAAAATLAVVFPVASLGLWLTVSWGAVLWALAAIIQILMYVIWPQIFGINHLVPFLHVLVGALYIVFRIALWLEERRKEERVRTDLP